MKLSSLSDKDIQEIIDYLDSKSKYWMRSVVIKLFSAVIEAHKIIEEDRSFKAKEWMDKWIRP